MEKRLLTSDKMPFLVLALGFPAGVLVIFGLLLVGQYFSTLKSLSRGAPEIGVTCSATLPTVCTEYNVRDSATERTALGIIFLTSAVILWMLAFRYRAVFLKEKNVEISWGEKFPISYKTWATKGINNFLITKELRYSVMPVGNIQKVTSAPTRWRLTANYHNKKINLGSYATEQDARNAVRSIEQA